MKSILIIALALATFSSAAAQGRKVSDSAKQTKDTKKNAKKAKSTAAPASAAATDDSANYVGTNDFYLALIREGVRKA